MAELNAVQLAENLKAHQVPRQYSNMTPQAYLSPPFWNCFGGKSTHIHWSHTNTILILKRIWPSKSLEYAHKVSWAQLKSLIS